MENDWATCGHRFWAFAGLAWNPALDPGAVMDDFLTRCWGASAAPIRRYYERWESGQKATPRVLRLALRDLEEAARLASSPDIGRRVDQMSLYLYWHLLNREFKQAKDEDTRNGIALEGDLFQYRWRDALMVQLVGSIFNAERPVKIGFPPAEVTSLRTSALQRFLPSSGPDIDLRTVWPADLVPVRDLRNLASLSACERDNGYLSEASYVFRARAGEAVQVMFEEEPPSVPASRDPAQAPPRPAVAPAADRDPLAMEDTTEERMGRFQLWFLGADGRDQDFVLERNPASSGGRALRFDFNPPRDGLYRLNAKVAKGGIHADFNGRPHVLSAQIKPAKNVLRLDRDAGMQAEPPPKGASGARYYFLVPAGTRCFQVEAVSSGRKQVALTFETAAGQPLATKAVVPEAECLVDVPAGSDGSVWALSTDASRVRLGLNGVPPWVATHPDNLLVPRGAIASTVR
jgi:hypothetical protein